MAADVEDALSIADLLDIEDRGAGIFVGSCHAGAPLQVFGGQVAAQALVAAGRTTVDRGVHALHGTFVRPGDSRSPVEYRVVRVRDGRTYATRLVTALQGSETIFVLTASFKTPEAGHDRQAVMPVVPAPEELPDPYVGFAAAHPEPYASPWRRAVALRFVPVAEPVEPGRNDQAVWMRATYRLPDDPVTQAAAFTYCSDLTLGHTAAAEIEPHLVVRDGPRRTQVTTLNHSVWFHRPFRMDNWSLFAQVSTSAADGRGLSTGELWSRDGRLVASAVQETVLRGA